MHSGPIASIEEANASIRSMHEQLERDGITRWAVVERQTGAFIGISGLRVVHEHRNGHEHYHSIGYRFLRQHWGKGYASEAAIAVLRYGFDILDLEEVFATTTLDNHASRRVLEKSGLRFVNEFDYHGRVETWYTITKQEWITHPQYPI